MSAENVLMGLIALGVLGYLLWALVNPERL